MSSHKSKVQKLPNNKTYIILKKKLFSKNMFGKMFHIVQNRFIFIYYFANFYTGFDQKFTVFAITLRYKRKLTKITKNIAKAQCNFLLEDFFGRKLIF